MQESYIVYEAWVCLDRQSNTCSQKDLLCSNVTTSHFLEFRPLVGTVASTANVISQLVPSKLICRVSVTCQLCCGDSLKTLGPTDESPSWHPLGGQCFCWKLGTSLRTRRKSRCRLYVSLHLWHLFKCLEFCPHHNCRQCRGQD